MADQQKLTMPGAPLGAPTMSQELVEVKESMVLAMAVFARIKAEKMEADPINDVSTDPTLQGVPKDIYDKAQKQKGRERANRASAAASRNKVSRYQTELESRLNRVEAERNALRAQNSTSDLALARNFLLKLRSAEPVVVGNVVPLHTLDAFLGATERSAGSHQSVPQQPMPQQPVTQQHVPQQHVPHQHVPQQHVPQQHIPQQHVPQQPVPQQPVPQQPAPHAVPQTVNMSNMVQQPSAAPAPVAVHSQPMSFQPQDLAVDPGDDAEAMVLGAQVSSVEPAAVPAPDSASVVSGGIAPPSAQEQKMQIEAAVAAAANAVVASEDQMAPASKKTRRV